METQKVHWKRFKEIENKKSKLTTVTLDWKQKPLIENKLDWKHIRFSIIYEIKGMDIIMGVSIEW